MSNEISAPKLEGREATIRSPGPWYCQPGPPSCQEAPDLGSRGLLGESHIHHPISPCCIAPRKQQMLCRERVSSRVSQPVFADITVVLSLGG